MNVFLTPTGLQLCNAKRYFSHGFPPRAERGNDEKIILQKSFGCIASLCMTMRAFISH